MWEDKLLPSVSSTPDTSTLPFSLEERFPLSVLSFNRAFVTCICNFFEPRGL